MNRPLLPEGVATATAIAKAMLAAGELPICIFCSNYARAVQTASIYGRVLDVNVASLGDLAPIRPLAPAISNLVQTKDSERLRRVMLVGHVDNTTPAMNDLGGDVKWAKLVMGEVRRVEIDRDDLGWELRWSLKPSDIGRPDHAT